MSLENILITAAEFDTPVNHKQLDAFDVWAKHNKGQVYVIPIQGQNSSDLELDPRLFNYNVLLNNIHNFSKKLQVRDFRVKAQQINPLTGLRRFGQTNISYIIGNPKQQLEYAANSTVGYPKMLTSTGVCTQPNYRDNRIGNIGKNDHVQGGIVVTLDGDKYHFRHIQSTHKGEFVDLGIKYTPLGKLKVDRADTLVVGDLHDAQTDEKAYEALINQIKYFSPKYIMLHDVFDAQSISYFDIGRSLSRTKKSIKNKLTLEKELASLGKRLEHISSNSPSDSKILIVKSNHDEMLDKYLDNMRFVNEPNNTQIGVRLSNAVLDKFDPLEEGVKEAYGKIPDKVRFLRRNEEFKRYGWMLSFHGDKGPGGSRGSMNGLEYSVGKGIVGHTHSAAILRGLYRVGTLERNDVEYIRGSPSNWTQTNAVIYNNGKAQLINTIDGKWKA